MNVRKIVFIVLGFLVLGLGIIGILLPLLPTTPFLLLASYFFVKGSKKFEVWFKNTAIYKNHLAEFIKQKGMTRGKKITINIFADCMILIPFILTDSIIIRVVLLLIVMYKYYYFIYKIKTT